MSLILQAWDELVADLTAADLTVIDDPRNLRPGCIIVDPPTIRGRSGSVVELEFPVTVVGAPPANRDAYRYLLDLADVVVETVPTSVGTPGTYQAGAQDLPSYQLTVTLTYRRDS